LKSSEKEITDDASKKSTKVSRKENKVQDPAKEDKDATGNMMFTLVNTTGSTYVYLGRSIHVNVVTLHTVDLPNDPLMPDLEDTVDIQDTGIFRGLKSSKKEITDDASKKSTKVSRKENKVQDPAKEGDKNVQKKDVRDQEVAL
nr:hypothetical protein [Tanacetum cinerariifolium]